MSSDRNSNTNPGSRGMNDNDKEYYEDLYNDLPKEVVDILMQTHPLMGKDGNTELSRSKRRPSREDIEEVREARMQQVGNEINEIRKAPQQEGEPTRYVSRRTRNNMPSMEDTNNGVSTGHKIEQDEYDDGIQYVSVMPARKKSKMVEEVAQQTYAPAKRKKSKREDNAFEDFAPVGRNRYEDMDFEEKAKQEHLDSLYDEYDDEDEYRGGMSKLSIILGIIGLILIIFLIFKCVSLSSKLEDAQNQVTATEELSGKYEKIQLEKMQLEEQLASLQNPSAEESVAENEGGQPADETETTTTNSTDSNTAASGDTTEYVVQKGDTAWSIAQKTLGNGAEFQKILDANNLKETDTIDVGTKLKIPR